MGAMSALAAEIEEARILIASHSSSKAAEKVRANSSSREYCIMMSELASYLYCDVDMSVSSCLEVYLEEDLGLDPDDAFNLSCEISSTYTEHFL